MKKSSPLLIVLLFFASSGLAQTITQQPANVSVPAGQTATFTVSFTGGTCSSVWYTSLGNFYGPRSASPLQYSVPNVTESMNGDFFQVILFSCTGGSATPLSTPATLTVTPSAPLASISVAPLTPTVAIGQTQAFTATGHYIDGSTQNLTASATWASDTPSVATVIPGGTVSALATGTANISATFQGFTASTKLAVDPAKIILTVNPNSALNFDDGSVVYNGTLVPEQWNPSTAAWVQAGNITSSNGSLSGQFIIDPNLADQNGNVQFQFSVPGVANMGLPSVPLIRFQQGSTGVTLNEVLFKTPFLTKLLAVEKVSEVSLTP